MFAGCKLRVLHTLRKLQLCHENVSYDSHRQHDTLIKTDVVYRPITLTALADSTKAINSDALFGLLYADLCESPVMM
jgi:hypothetical protein